MEEHVKNTMQLIRQTLDMVEVHGAGNMDKLLGCIQAIDRLLEEDNGKQTDK